MATGLPPPDCDERVTRLLAYWRSIHPSGGGLPGRAHFEPTALPDLLRWLWLVDVARAPLRFRCRLVGTGHRAMMGRDFTGSWVDEIFPNFAATERYADFAAAAAGETRWYRGASDFAAAKNYVATERLVLPLASDGAAVDMLLGLTLYTLKDGRVA
jgi:hypothetical protein